MSHAKQNGILISLSMSFMMVSKRQPTCGYYNCFASVKKRINYINNNTFLQYVTCLALFQTVPILRTQGFLLHSPICQLPLHSQKYARNLLSSTQNNTKNKTISIRKH